MAQSINTIFFIVNFSCNSTSSSKETALSLYFSLAYQGLELHTQRRQKSCLKIDKRTYVQPFTIPCNSYTHSIKRETRKYCKKSKRKLDNLSSSNQEKMLSTCGWRTLINFAFQCAR